MMMMKGKLSRTTTSNSFSNTNTTDHKTTPINNNNNNSNNYNTNKSSNGFLPNSLRMIGSCIKTVSANATSVASSVKSAASAISAPSHDHKDQVTWACFDRLELSASVCRHVLLLGYHNGFQVIDVDDASNFCEIVSRRDNGPVTFLQMQPIPLRSSDHEGFYQSHPLLLVVGGNETKGSGQIHAEGRFGGVENNVYMESSAGNTASTIQFYSLKSHSFVHVLNFRSNVCMVRCNPHIVAVGLAKQIYCLDALTLEKIFSLLTYPVPQVVEQGKVGINIGCGPMAVGPRWLAYASNDPLLLKTGRLSPQTLSHSPGASSSTSPVTKGMVAHYALESGKHLAAGIVHIGDKGYKTLSKYCQERLPDRSNSSQSTGSRAARSLSTESDNAGVVAVMDFESRMVICQFRAHSTAISALCFDPSGTLLVTASVNGNSINIFRIMPCRDTSGSGLDSYKWSSSYVHLYRFRRGIRAAIIQDICFSHHSQWVAVVSSKGTCHLFVLSPFGGDVGFQNVNGHGGEPSIAPVLTLPWWSATACRLRQQSFRPPPPVTLSVVSRLKDNKYSLLNTVSSAAASVSGKASVPTGALAAIFHSSLPCSPHQVQVAVKSLEHLLVFTPSGHVVQHEIQPSFSVQGGSDSKIHSSSSSQFEDLGVNINICPVQWWDVCRRSDWLEREDFMPDFFLEDPQASVVYRNPITSSFKADVLKGNSSLGRNNTMRMKSSNSDDRSHWYLSKAEVQFNNMCFPVGRKSKITFCIIGPSPFENANWEYEIEKLPVSEVEMRRKDLLPVFDNFHSMKSNFHDSVATAGRYSNSFDHPPHMKEKTCEETIICHSKPASLGSTESSDGGSSRRIDQLLDLENPNPEQEFMPSYQNSNKCGQDKSTDAVDELHEFGNKLGAESVVSLHTDSPSYMIGANVSSDEPDVPFSESPSMSVGVVSYKTALSSDINLRNEVPGENAFREYSSDIFGTRSILSETYHPISSQTLANTEETDGENNSAVHSSINTRKLIQDQEKDFLFPRFSCTEKDGKENMYGLLIDFSDLGVEPGGYKNSSDSPTHGPVSCNNSNQEEHGLFGLMFPSLEGGHNALKSAGAGRVTEAVTSLKSTSSNSNLSGERSIPNAQDIVGISAWPKNNDTTPGSREFSANKASCSAILSKISSGKFNSVQNFESEFEGLVAQASDGRKIIRQGELRSSIVAASSLSQGSSDNSTCDLVQEKVDHTLSDWSSLLGNVGHNGQASEPVVCHKNTEDAGNISVSEADKDEKAGILGRLAHVTECRHGSSISSKEDDCDEDEHDMLGALFCSEDEMDNGGSFMGKEVLDGVQDDMLGARFPFLEEG